VIINDTGLKLSESLRTLSETDKEVVNLVAVEIIKKVYELLGKV